ncbi:hypothetical protein PAV_12c00470 [Paenibacillus alvei DSM 29]|nr:hypothetical protein PAV_12c00470 [Paenibacillus alvei DSM 29]
MPCSFNTVVWEDELVILYILRDQLKFNIPENRFINGKDYKSFLYLGSIIRNQYISPTGCNAISETKRLSLYKAFSESLERKSLMAGGDPLIGNMVPTFELISGKPSCLPFERTIYRSDKTQAIDTTGTAAHYNSFNAVTKAILELLEKNALFTFWYGKIGSIIPNILFEDNLYYKKLNLEDCKVMIFKNDVFAPIIVIISIVVKNNIIVSSGVAASCSFEESLNHSIREAYLLKWQLQRTDIYENGINSKSINERALEHLSSFSIADCTIFPSSDTIYTKITEYLPEWIDNLHVIFLKNTTFPYLNCVKVYSSNLYNHIPSKRLINLDCDINKHVTKLTTRNLESYPECLVV